MQPRLQNSNSPWHANWRRALESVVHGGMVVGMVTFVGLDLLNVGQSAQVGWLIVAIGVLAGVIVVLFRREPFIGLLIAAAISVAVTIGAIVTGQLGVGVPFVGFGEVAAISILSSELARRSEPQRIAIGLVIAVVTTALSAAFRSPSPLSFMAVFWLVLTLAVVAGLTLRWTDRSRQFEAEVAQREERLSIARELHDGVAHHVTGIVVQAQAARSVGRSDLDAIETALVRIEENGLETMSALRHLVGALRDQDGSNPLEPTAGVADIEALVAEVESLSEFDVALHLDRDAVPEAFGSSVYRIVQESLTNVRRHGLEVAKVEISISARDEGIGIEVIDDGNHRERRRGRGFGLSGMSERVAALGGQIWAGERPGKGWAVTAWIPLDS